MSLKCKQILTNFARLFREVTFSWYDCKILWNPDSGKVKNDQNTFYLPKQVLSHSKVINSEHWTHPHCVLGFNEISSQMKNQSWFSWGVPEWCLTTLVCSFRQYIPKWSLCDPLRYCRCNAFSPIRSNNNNVLISWLYWGALLAHPSSEMLKYVGVQSWKDAHLQTLEIRVEQEENRVMLLF